MPNQLFKLFAVVLSYARMRQPLNSMHHASGHGEAAHNAPTVLRDRFPDTTMMIALNMACEGALPGRARSDVAVKEPLSFLHSSPAEPQESKADLGDDNHTLKTFNMALELRPRHCKCSSFV